MVSMELAELNRDLVSAQMSGPGKGDLSVALEALCRAREQLVIAADQLRGWAWSDPKLLELRLPLPEVEVERLALRASLLADLLIDDRDAAMSTGVSDR